MNESRKIHLVIEAWEYESENILSAWTDERKAEKERSRIEIWHRKQWHNRMPLGLSVVVESIELNKRNETFE